jgi:hypothetical protein
MRRLAASAMSRASRRSVPSRSNTTSRKAPVRPDRSSVIRPCRKRTARRLPHPHANHAETLVSGIVENQLRDLFDGRIAVDQEHRLLQILERLDERVVTPEDHLVVDLAIDPRLHDPVDIAEIADHVAAVEHVGPDLDFGHGVVPVRVLADSVVVEQAVAVAEVKALGH